jgi:hypothetical protein
MSAMKRKYFEEVQSPKSRTTRALNQFQPGNIKGVQKGTKAYKQAREDIVPIQTKSNSS